MKQTRSCKWSLVKPRNIAITMSTICMVAMAYSALTPTPALAAAPIKFAAQLWPVHQAFSPTAGAPATDSASFTA